MQNPSIKTHDLLVKNVTESDVGLYYCGGHEKKKTNRRTDAGFVFEDVYHHGNIITRLSLFGKITHSDLFILLVSDICLKFWQDFIIISLLSLNKLVVDH